MSAPFPPIRRVPARESGPLKPEDAGRAIALVREALPLFRAGEPILHPDHVDVPVMYLDFAIDRVHYDPRTGTPAPKGAPPHCRPSLEGAKERVEAILKEARVVDAAEFREPEDCWVVPVAWETFIILHVRVSADGKELVPDYPLTEEVRRYGR
ncbi:hypothetical protein CL1_1848 [Thermococcus cleftensis]|uniref:Uncharacterized protein n=1 Tax=Thermococcus cleftensis (strain DSM 27260 / KACC 17922 / CL1) TaxID=163003 RepID=I3ZWG0_THECF|nr:hypothetical protein [Thermococcus cleftensis]AFL96044.1 hypothetical protein CL1_1848 [Thermococcus cleftensis]